MPELPEVETIVRDLRDQAGGQALEGLDLVDPRVWSGSRRLLARFSGRVPEIGRRAKYIVYRFGTAGLVQHLRMTGTMLPEGSPAIPAGLARDPRRRLQLRARFRFAGGQAYVFWDSRRFGTIAAVPDLEAGWRSLALAPEWLETGTPGRAMARSHFVAGIAGRRGPVKSLLLDPTLICGTGNIYADEALHRSRIHPLVPGGLLGSRRAGRLFDAAVGVMLEAIGKRGTSMSDYLDVNGKPGVFSRYLDVYGREGEPCRTCGRAIARMRIGGRSSHYCPRCQRAAAPGR